MIFFKGQENSVELLVYSQVTVFATKEESVIDQRDGM